MQEYTQKYCLVQLLTPLPGGTTFAMSDWPLHVTLADVFAIDGVPDAVLARLGEVLTESASFSSTIVGEDRFGPTRSVQVRLLDKTPALRDLHETCVAVLEEFGAVFNTPQYMHDGFKPHSTIRGEQALAIDDTVRFDGVTLIDMFPGGDHTQRRIVATVPLGA